MSRVKRDHLAGLFIIVLGLGTLSQAVTYPFGTMTNVGPGFIPTILGLILSALGIGIAATAGPDDAPEAHAVHVGLDVRGWACIVGSVLSFVALANYAGLIPATFVCVLVAALGDRNARVPTSVLLAAGITVFGVAVFHYGLRVQMPLVRGFWQ